MFPISPEGSRLSRPWARRPGQFGLMALGVVGLLIAFGGSQQDSQPDAAAELDLLDRAGAARGEGAYEEAAALYERALTLGVGPRHEIALGAAEAYLAARDYGRAAAMARRALEENPAASDAYLLEAQAWLGLDRPEEAQDALLAHLRSGPVAGYGAFLGAESWAAQGDPARAREWYAWSLDLGLARLWEILAMRGIGETLGAEAEPGAAAVWFERAAARAEELEDEEPPVWYDGELVRRASEARRPALLLRAGVAHRAAGAVAPAADAYREAASTYPTAREALAALDSLAELGLYYTVDPYWRGRILLQADRPREAIEAFSKALSDGTSQPAAAAYYAGIARREAGDLGGAVGRLIAMARLYPENRLAPEALWQAARLVHITGTAEAAARAYIAVADAFPSSRRAAEALVRAGWLHWQAGDWSAARAAWARLGYEHPDSRFRAEGLFWLGRGLLGQGDERAGLAALGEAEEASPRAYEGLRARDVREGGLAAEPYARGSTSQLGLAPIDDGPVCSAWIDGWANSPEGRGGSVDRQERIGRLLAAGMRAAAQAEALDAIAEAGDSLHGLHSLARELSQRGLYPVSMYAAATLASISPTARVDRSPPCLRRLVYPLAFGERVQRHASAHGLDPYLVLALLRQESWFGTHARSPANALGLSQVIPGTAVEIARALGREGFAHEDLVRPRESIAFGSWYLAQQLGSFVQRPLLALAAYNGGPASVARWTTGNPAMDPDDFLQAIDFPETRTYVRTIYETYARYRELYG